MVLASWILALPAVALAGKAMTHLAPGAVANEAVVANMQLIADAQQSQTPTKTENPRPDSAVQLDSTITMGQGDGSCGGCGGGGSFCNWDSSCAGTDCLCQNLENLCSCLIQMKIHCIEGLFGGVSSMMGSIMSGVDSTFSALTTDHLFAKYKISDLFNENKTAMVKDFSRLITGTSKLAYDTLDFAHTAAEAKVSNKLSKDDHANLKKLVAASRSNVDKVIEYMDPISKISTEIEHEISSALGSLKVSGARLAEFANQHSFDSPGTAPTSRNVTLAA